MSETVLRNRVPDLLRERDWNISKLQRETQMSYPATYNIATVEVISDDTRVGTLRKVALALGVSVGELVSIEEADEE